MQVNKHKSISNGIKLSCDKRDKIIRLENCCDCKIYWTWPGLDMVYSKGEFKSSMLLRPGESTVIFNFNLINWNNCDDFVQNNLLLEFNIVNISLGKYWGEGSRRKSIEYCPRWLNVSINLEYFDRF